MKLKINNNGVSIDVSHSEALTEQFSTTHGTIPRERIDRFRIFKNHPQLGDVVEIVDTDRKEYYVHHSLVIEINGNIVSFASAVELFNFVNNLLFGF